MDQFAILVSGVACEGSPQVAQAAALSEILLPIVRRVTRGVPIAPLPVRCYGSPHSPRRFRGASSNAV